MTETDLLSRRRRTLSPGYELFYDEPLHLVRGEGVWLTDAAGTRYLDCYNNVPSVGHCHPRVVEAIARQAALLNTHTRYLHETVVALAERLGDRLPGSLSMSLFACTGTEANDLAVQIARAATGREGVIVSEASYHGNSTLVGALSTAEYPPEERPDWLGVVEPPNTYRGPFRSDHRSPGAAYADLVDEAIETLDARGHGAAAVLVDSVWDSNGVLLAPDDYLARVAAAVRAAGGVVIADEVQAGYCRTGSWWGFERYGIVPDIVTLGKPMGAGHPVAAVVTTPELAAAFAARRHYFNTFGGNPVSAAAALAVLDVIDGEGLLDNASSVGAHLGRGLGQIASRHDVVGNVQGAGLFWGLDLVADRATREPLAPLEARRIASELAGRRVLMGVTGRYGNVLKIRPPLVFSREHADAALEALDDCLGRYRTTTPS